MTITMTDVLTTLTDDGVRTLLSQAVDAIEARERRARAAAAAATAQRQAYYDAIVQACRPHLPLAVRPFVVAGLPEGWDPPAPHGAPFLLEIALPGLQLPFRARFKGFKNKPGTLDWRLECYVLPGLQSAPTGDRWRVIPSFDTGFAARTTDTELNQALAYLVKLEADYRSAQESGDVIDMRTCGDPGDGDRP